MEFQVSNFNLPALALAAIWKVNQWMQEGALSLSAFHTNQCILNVCDVCVWQVGWGGGSLFRNTVDVLILNWQNLPIHGHFLLPCSTKTGETTFTGSSESQ